MKKVKRIVIKHYLSTLYASDGKEERHVSQRQHNKSKGKRKRKSSISNFIKDDLKVYDDEEQDEAHGGEQAEAKNGATFLHVQTQKQYNRSRAGKTKMEFPPKKKVKRNVIKNYLSILPEDIFLIVLQYSEIEEVEKTRPFQTTWIKKCTMFVDMEYAFHAQNLDNMKWIKGRNEGDLNKQCCFGYFRPGTFFIVSS